MAFPAQDIEQAVKHLRRALDKWRVDPDEQPAEAGRWADLLDLTESLERYAGIRGAEP